MNRLLTPDDPAHRVPTGRRTDEPRKPDRVMPVRLGPALAVCLLLGSVAACGSGSPTVQPSASLPSSSSAPSPGSPSPSSSPSASPMPSPLPTESLFVPFVDDPSGRGIQLTIGDPQHLVRRARAATEIDMTTVDLDDGIGITDLGSDPAAIVVAWLGTVCDLTAVLDVANDGSSLTVVEGLAPGCDLVPLRRGVVLQLASANPASGIAVKLIRSAPVEAIARSQAERFALAYWGPTATVADVAFARAADLDLRVQPPDRVVWAIAVDSGEPPGSCPSAAAGTDTFAVAPCRALARATLFLDAVSGAYLGYVPG